VVLKVQHVAGRRFRITGLDDELWLRLLRMSGVKSKKRRIQKKAVARSIVKLIRMWVANEQSKSCMDHARRREGY
jgi:hypothetical protein